MHRSPSSTWAWRGRSRRYCRETSVAATSFERGSVPGTADMTEGPAMTRAEALRDRSTSASTVVAGLRASGVDTRRHRRHGHRQHHGGERDRGRPDRSDAGRRDRPRDRHRRRDAPAQGRRHRAGDRPQRPRPGGPDGVLAAVGGLEIGALVGVILGAVAGRVPLVLDGFITGAAALLAARLATRDRGGGSSPRTAASNPVTRSCSSDSACDHCWTSTCDWARGPERPSRSA